MTRGKCSLMGWKVGSATFQDKVTVAWKVALVNSDLELLLPDWLINCFTQKKLTVIVYLSESWRDLTKVLLRPYRVQHWMPSEGLDMLSRSRIKILSLWKVGKVCNMLHVWAISWVFLFPGLSIWHLSEKTYKSNCIPLPVNWPLMSAPLSNDFEKSKRFFISFIFTVIEKRRYDTVQENSS